MAAWDGTFYTRILRDGYRADSSDFAFFPFYAWLGWPLHKLGVPAALVLLIESHLFRFASILLFHDYLSKKGVGESHRDLALTAFVFFPTTFHHSMAYTESMFVCVSLLFFLTLDARRSLYLLALIAGIASGTRFVGIVFFPLVLLVAMTYWNPIYYFGFVGLLLWAATTRQLNRYEILFCALVLSIPYLSQGYRTFMTAHARYASVAFPLYLIMGKLLITWPRSFRILSLCIAVLLLAVYTGLFCTGHRLP
jgi:hypothetical protein